MTQEPRVWLLAAALAAVVALAAFLAGALTVGGAVAAGVVGWTVLLFGGPGWAVLLVGFFVSSAALTRWRLVEKWAMATGRTKGERRDAGQVVANGSVAAVIALASGLTGNELLFAAFVGAVAAVTADTWATEVGLLSRLPPRLVTTGLVVQPGTSGAVTTLGSAAAAAAGIFVGSLAALVVLASALATESMPDVTGVRFLVVAPVAGLTGAALDSFLGATVQSVRRCPRCEKETEREVHTCGTPTRPVRGWSWLNGDVVNMSASLTGAVVGLALELLVFA